MFGENSRFFFHYLIVILSFSSKLKRRFFIIIDNCSEQNKDYNTLKNDYCSISNWSLKIGIYRLQILCVEYIIFLKFHLKNGETFKKYVY